MGSRQVGTPTPMMCAGPAQEVGRPVAVPLSPRGDEVASADDDGILGLGGATQRRPGRGVSSCAQDGQAGRRREVLAEDIQEQLVAVVARTVEADDADPWR